MKVRVRVSSVSKALWVAATYLLYAKEPSACNPSYCDMEDKVCQAPGHVDRH